MNGNFEPDTEVNVTDRPAAASQAGSNHPSLHQNQTMRPGAIMSQADDQEVDLDILEVQNRPAFSQDARNKVVSVDDVSVEVLSAAEELHQRPQFEDRSMLLGKGELMSEKNVDHEIYEHASSVKPMDDLFKGLQINAGMRRQYER